MDLPDCVEAMAREGVVSADHIPVIASLIQDDAALMGCPGTPAAGTVARARGDVIDRRTDFPDYYLAQLEYDKQSTEFIKKRYGPKPEGVPHAVLINRARTAPHLVPQRRREQLKETPRFSHQEPLRGATRSTARLFESFPDSTPPGLRPSVRVLDFVW